MNPLIQNKKKLHRLIWNGHLIEMELIGDNLAFTVFRKGEEDHVYRGKLRQGEVINCENEDE